MFISLITTDVFSQNHNNDSTIFNFHKMIKLDEHTQTEAISIVIEEKTKKFELEIETKVSSGKLTIEIYDSSNKKQGTFAVGNQLDIADSEESKGRITKSLMEPLPGKWKVKVIPINAEGIISINTASFL